MDLLLSEDEQFCQAIKIETELGRPQVQFFNAVSVFQKLLQENHQGYVGRYTQKFSINTDHFTDKDSKVTDEVSFYHLERKCNKDNLEAEFIGSDFHLATSSGLRSLIVDNILEKDKKKFHLVKSYR